MNTADQSRWSDDYYRVERAIHFIEANFRSQPSLDEIAQSAHLSPYHFERLFKRWAGITPHQFLRFMTLDYTKAQLAKAESLLEASLAAGLSGPGRLHDLFVTFEAMTPGEFKKQGAGLEITYGFSPSPLGECLLASTQRGLCYLGFAEAEGTSDALGQLFQTWPGAYFVEDREKALPIVKQIFQKGCKTITRPFHLLVKGTNFQIHVWKALMTIPRGHIVSYQAIANLIGRPKAHRAVANAVAVNPVAYLIPCHRVIAKSGKIHRYRWGAERKKAMIGWEAAKKE